MKQHGDGDGDSFVICVVAGNLLWNKLSELHDNEPVAQLFVHAVFLQLNGR
jgi:hypothetical protein